MKTGETNAWQGPALRTLFALKYILGEKKANAWLSGLNARLVKSFERQLAKNGPGSVRPVATERDLSLSEFRDKYQSKNIPVVLKGAASNWECVRKWDLDFLKKSYGDDAVSVLYPKGLSLTDDNQDLEESTLGEFIESIQNGGKKYLRFHPFLMEHPELLEDLDLNWIRKIQTRGVLRPEYQIFVGPQGSHTPVHCAMPCNLFVQVHGTKRWMLFEPNDFPLLKPNLSGLSYYETDVDPLNVDTEEYPLFPYAHAQEVILEPGDIFWNPPYMWHCVTNDTPTIGIGYRFNNPWLALKASPTLLGLRFAARHPNVFQSLYYALRKTNLIVSIEREKVTKKT